jgi:uncharacterized protein
MSVEILLFAKTPRLGRVKTRLEPAFGTIGALKAYRTLLAHTLNTLAHAQRTLAVRVTVLHAPDRFAHGFVARAQARGDLGARLRAAFAQSDGPALAIGTDCPALNVDDLAQAAAALHTHDAVLGPAHDGGYWAIGLARPAPRLFERIDWSTARVYAQTQRRAQQLKLRVATLRTLADIDTPSDWRAVRERLQKR